MAQLTSTTISGNLSVIGNAIASKIIKIGGTSSQILMADGSTRLISELITDTGATSITTSGSGNAVTSGSYDATTRQITLNKGTTFVTSASSSNMTVSTSGGVITITHPTTTATAAGLYKIGKDALGHVVIGAAITPSDLGLSTVYKYKGTKTWAQLKALTSAEVGDVYSITDKDPDGNTNADWACYTKVTAATGDNYANYWQSLGGKVDLSNYVTLDGTQTITGKKTFSGGLAITKADENKNMTYILGIDAFADGGAVRWTNKANLKAGYADSAGDSDKLDGKDLTDIDLQLVTDNGAVTTRAIQTNGLTTNSTLYVTGTTGHREGIRIAPYSGTLSSIWWNASGTQDYSTGQMWGITAYMPTYTTDATKQNTFRFRGPATKEATAATDQMWINMDGLVTSRGGFAKNGSSNSYVLLAGGGTKAISDFATGGNITVKANDVLAVSSTNELSTKYTNTAATTVTVGGLTQGSSVDGWSLKQILDKLLYKYTSPAVSSVTYTASQTNDYICGSVTFSKAVARVAANSVSPGITSSTFTWNGNTYTGNNAGTTINAFGTKDITFTMNYTFTGTASTTSIAAKSGTASVVLSNAGENGEAKTVSKSQNSTAYYFDRSEYYWGGAASATDTAYNKDNTGNNTQRTKLGTGTGTALTAVLNNQVFTLVLPKKWGTTLSVYDGASNPVTGVFKNAGEVTITNKNNYAETYIVWKGAAATGTIKYFFHIG